MEAGEPADRPVVDALFALDERTRPPNARGHATRGLRDHAYARYCGRLDEAERHAEKAVTDLAAFQLPRHEKVVEGQGYLAA